MFSYFWATLITFGFYIRVVLHALSPSSFSVFRGNVQFLSFAFERVSSLPCSRSSIEYIWPVFLFVWHYFGARFSVSWVTWIETRHRQTTGSERQKKKREDRRRGKSEGDNEGLIAITFYSSDCAVRVASSQERAHHRRRDAFSFHAHPTFILLESGVGVGDTFCFVPVVGNLPITSALGRLIYTLIAYLRWWKCPSI